MREKSEAEQLEALVTLSYLFATTAKGMGIGKKVFSRLGRRAAAIYAKSVEIERNNAKLKS